VDEPQPAGFGGFDEDRRGRRRPAHGGACRERDCESRKQASAMEK
jgi:hypothetical protein